MNRAKAKRTRHRPGHTEVFGTEPAKRRVNLRLVMMLAMILLVAGGIIGLSMAVPDKQATRVAGTTARTIPALANNSGIANPRPNQYDPLTDRYWHVPVGGTAHWHNGQPPANAAAASTIFNSSSSSSVNPNIPNPTPNQYDPVTNRYWHVPVGGTAHWHNGQPPANSAAATPGFNPTITTGSSSSFNPDIPNPTPNQYDPVTDRYWHAPVGGTAHWHNGQPPA